MSRKYVEGIQIVYFKISCVSSLSLKIYLKDQKK
jgi:hypothetical protein